MQDISLLIEIIYKLRGDNKMRYYIKLMRPKHYIKNLLVFFPLVFSGMIFELPRFIYTLIGMISFCLISSVVYIINDINDVEADRKNEKKKNRPIASGKISVKNAIIFSIILFLIVVLINIVILKDNWLGYFFIGIYFILNILYSFKLKHKPIIDIVILSSGFLLRLLYGASITNIEVSNWLYLTVLSISFYMGLGKRRNESIKSGDSGREVLKYYNKNFLDKNMYMFLALAIAFYSLWCIDINIPNIIWTVPIIMIICMQYSLIIESDSYGDPVDVILENKPMLFTGILYAIIMFVMIYLIK